MRDCPLSLASSVIVIIIVFGCSSLPWAVSASTYHTTSNLHIPYINMALPEDENWTKSQLMGGVEESAAPKKGKVSQFRVKRTTQE